MKNNWAYKVRNSFTEQNIDKSKLANKIRNVANDVKMGKIVEIIEKKDGIYCVILIILYECGFYYDI